MQYKISKSDWERIGNTMGWMKEAQDLGSDKASFTLPFDLKGAKLSYGYGMARFDVQFSSDWDKISYILHSAQQKGTQSKAHDKYVAALERSGLQEMEAVAHGAEVKAFVKNIAKEKVVKGETSGIIQVPSMA